MTIVLYISISLFVLLFLLITFLAFFKRREERVRFVKEAYENVRQLNLAVAGSDEGCHKAARTVSVRGLECTRYQDSKGHDLNPSDYNLYIVDGESMQFCGIHDNDLLFSTKGCSFDKSAEFPMVLVIKKNHIANDCPAYKIRRAWRIANYEDNLLAIAKELLQSDEFQQIRRLSDYDDDNAVIKDFEVTRLKRYEESFINCENPNEMDKEVVISTTYHTKDKQIRLSIHPVTKVMGQVIASFPLSKDQLAG